MTVEISLKNPIPSGSLTGELSGLAYVETFKEIKALLKEGKPVYIRIDDGDRKGSIAKFITYFQKITIFSLYFREDLRYTYYSLKRK